MPHRIHTFGASGSGTSTLGRCLADRTGGTHLDTDSYYWLPTDPPFTQKREPASRVSMIKDDIQCLDNWVLSGSICNWGDPLLDSFTSAVFLYLDPTIRMARLIERERKRHGSRVLPGGDMYEAHMAFIDWARSYDIAKAPVRSVDLHERWMRGLNCPVIRVDSSRPVNELCDEILQQLAV